MRVARACDLCVATAAAEVPAAVRRFGSGIRQMCGFELTFIYMSESVCACLSLCMWSNVCVRVGIECKGSASSKN